MLLTVWAKVSVIVSSRLGIFDLLPSSMYSICWKLEVYGVQDFEYADQVFSENDVGYSGQR